VLTPISITITAQGDPPNLQTFLASLTKLDRLITIDAVNFATIKAQKGIINQLTVQAKAYYRL